MSGWEGRHPYLPYGSVTLALGLPEKRPSELRVPAKCKAGSRYGRGRITIHIRMNIHIRIRNMTLEH